MQTIMITGCSSGFGLETARYFLEQGWKVIATMQGSTRGSAAGQRPSAAGAS